MYSSKDIPGVGEVEYSWFNDPLPPAAQPPVKALVGDGDVGMAGTGDEGDKNGGTSASGGAGGGGGGAEVLDYDVAEEDDRWMAE